MPKTISIELTVPGELDRLRLPKGLNARLRQLLDKQDEGIRLTAAERLEAEGIAELGELLSLLRLRAERGANGRGAKA